jgi:diguanylate cyclase (GGDEF)-like protein/PAS domain S-box-containing protein
MPAKTKSKHVLENARLPARTEHDIPALMASEVRYRRLFETAKDGILILNADTGKITDVNPFLEEMLGYSHDELIGKALWEIGPVKDIVASQEAMRHLQEKEYIRYDNLPLETKWKQRVQVEFVSNVYLVDGFRVIQCNIRDITARRNAENDAQKAHTELLGLVDELKIRDREMKLLIHMNDLLQSCTLVSEAYQVVSTVAQDLFVGLSGCFAILNEEKHLETVATWGNNSIFEPTFLLKDCWAMRRGQPHETMDPAKDLLCQHFLLQPPTGTLCLPLMVQGEILGLFSLVGGTNGKYSSSHQQIAVAMGDTIKLSISNIRLREDLREQAIRDPLTGLYNRRYLEENLARELYRAQRQGTDLCIAMVDLDDFKQINDTFGHGAGDLVLREMGNILTGHLRNSDISCRYGGDEFLLALPDSSLADTHQRMEQIRQTVRGCTIHYGGKTLRPITISAGIATAAAHNFQAIEIIQAADKALFIAKSAGHDQVANPPAKN